MSRIPAALIVAGFLLASAIFNPFAATAAGYSRDASVAAIAIYATLRSMTAVLSIVRDADVGVSFPVEATFSPGQTLTPLTQTVERFADIMFVVALWSAALAVLLDPAASIGAVAAGLALLALVVLAWSRIEPPPAARRILRATASLGLVFALLLPLAYSIAFWLGDGLTSEATEQATEVLTRAATEEAELPTTSGLGWGYVRDMLDDAQAVLDMAGDIFQASVDLSVAYLLKLVVLPVLLALSIWWLARSFRVPLISVEQPPG